MHPNYKHKNFRFKKLAFAALVICAGITLLLINTGIIPHEYKSLIFSWKTLIIGIGFVNLFSRESLPTGIILTLIGASFVFADNSPMHIKLHEVLIPLILILIGIAVLFHKKKSRCKLTASCHNTQTDESVLEEINIFSGNKKMFTGPVFNGGSMINVFGGTEIDLRNSTLPPETGQLDLICVFGGASLIVPDDWTIKFETVAILGGFADKRSKLIETDANKTLVIKGICIFGGGEIKTCETCNY